MTQITIEDNNTQRIGSSYTSSNIASSRYSMASSSSKRSSNNNNYNFNVNFTEPYKWYKQYSKVYLQSQQLQQSQQENLSECSICYEPSVVFILIRQMVDGNNIPNISTDPHSYIYSENLCYKCADYFCHNKVDPVRVPCIAAIPIMNFPLESKQIFYDSLAQLIINHTKSKSYLIKRQSIPKIDPKQTHIINLKRALYQILKEYYKQSAQMLIILQKFNTCFNDESVVQD
jgi:hypothetical protein